MAASGGGRRGAGETREAIGAALSTRGRCASRTSLRAPIYFNDLPALLRNFFRPWFWLHRPEPGRVMRHAGRGCFAPEWAMRNSRDRCSYQKDVSRRLPFPESIFSVFNGLRRHLPSNCSSRTTCVLRRREARLGGRSRRRNRGTTRWTILRDTMLRIACLRMRARDSAPFRSSLRE